MTEFIATNPAYRVEPYAMQLINEIFQDDDPRDAKEQLAERYDTYHMECGTRGFRLQGNWRTPGEAVIQFWEDGVAEDAQDSPLPEIARATLRDETLILMVYDWLVIVQPDGAFEVTRVD